MKKDGSSQVRRQLDFREKILTKTIFYIDIREDDLKKRITRRVRDLGGQVEDFLSKDVNILLTDSNSTAQKTSSLAPNASTDTKVAVPLSRGKALLLKATKQSSCQQSVKGTDIVQNALNMGVKVEKAKDFLKSTHKYAQKLKQVKALQSDGIDGITPLQWKNSDKENFIVLKVEDDKQTFRPFLKHFKDSFPKIRYDDDLASPFDKGVTLCRTVENKTKNRYSTKGKPTVTTGKGGFCEACDYWYRCSLREHLSSMKHQKFVQTNTNFKQLDQIINKMPKIQDFMSKFNLDYVRSADSEHTQVLSEKLDTKCSVEDVDSHKTTIETCDTVMEVSVSTVNHDEELSNCAMVISPSITERGNTNCETDMAMEVDMSTSKYPLDECSRDSGTGPEIQEDISVPCDFVQTIDNNRGTGFIVDEDSAFPQDQASNDMTDCETTTGSVLPNSTLSQSISSISYPCIDNENAVFLDLTVKKNNIPVQEVTSNVRKKLSAIAIADNNVSPFEGFLNNNFSEENKENIENSEREPSSFSFAGIDSLIASSPVCNNASPKSVIPGGNLDFANIAADWMKDMSQSQAQHNQEAGQTSPQKERSSKKSKKHSSVSKKRKKSKKKYLRSKGGDWPFSLFKTSSYDSSESDLELPQLPVLNSNLAKQRLIEEERKLHSSPIQFCSRQVPDQRVTSTCTKKRVKLFGRHPSKSQSFKQLGNSPSISNSERLRNIQTKMPQYFSDKLPCHSTPTHSPMVLDISPPQLSHFSSCQIQQDVQSKSCPVLTPLPASSNTEFNDKSECCEVLDSSSQTLPYMQSVDCDDISGTPRDLTSENFRLPSVLDNSETEEYYDSQTLKASISQCNSDNAPFTQSGEQNVDKEMETLQEFPNQSEYGSDTEPYIPYSPLSSVFKPVQQQSSNQPTTICTNTLDRSACLVKPCSELSFSVDSILSGQTGKKRTLKMSVDSEGGLTSPSSVLNNNALRPTQESMGLPMATTEKKKRKRKRHASKKDKNSGCQYYACSQGGTKIKLCRVMVTPMEQKNNLKTFWKVTKAGSCRLVFSAEKDKGNSNSDFGKRKWSEDQVQVSKRRKLVY